MIRFNERLQRAKDEEGFTLIELMVVVLIIAILIAIAIPTFLGARRRAQDRAAQSSLRNAVTAAKAVFTDQEDYAPAIVDAEPAVPDGAPDELADGEPSLTFVLGAVDSDDATTVSVTSDNTPGDPAPKDTRFVGAALSDSGVCWYVQDVAGPSGIPAGTGGTKWARVDNAGTTCSADDGALIAFDNIDVAGGWYRKAADTQAA